MHDFMTSLPSSPLRFFKVGLPLLLLICSGLAWADSATETAVTPPPPARQAELLNLVRQDCGSCHGLRFEGGLGVPLTPEILKGKPVESLRDTILYGREGTTMPPWNPFLTEAEAAWIVQLLMKGLP